MKSKIRTLHVEDDLIDAILIKEMLAASGGKPDFDLIYKPCLETSLKAFSQGKFDLILLDLSIGSDNSMDIIPLFTHLTQSPFNSALLHKYLICTSVF